jgi:3-(3-hydroxy-phenyl)propionate hydroxylase
VRTLVVERNPATSDEPKAVTIDDVALRTLQRAGVADAVYEAILTGTGTKYYGRHGQLLAYARGDWPPRNGHPVKNPFQQPELERVLLACARRFETVEVRFSTAFEALQQDPGGVTATFSDGRQARCEFLLACDGGRSMVRSRIGLKMAGSSFREPWIARRARINRTSTARSRTWRRSVATRVGGPWLPLVSPRKLGTTRGFARAPGRM